MTDEKFKIAFQGEPGANSHIACREVFPEQEVLACHTFEEALNAVSDGAARYGMIPVENSVAGRVADIHHLLPESGLFIIGEHFLRVRHNLLALPGTKVSDLKSVLSHTQALGQCRSIIRSLGIEAVTAADTAGAARIVSEEGNKTQAAIASRLAGEIYGLEELRRDIEDEDHNTTRFLILSRERKDPPPGGDTITSFLFRVRNVPASLYKAMGGFATNGVNMIKLESYQIAGSFNATQFFADIEGHPSEHSVILAMEELEFFTNRIRVLGAYPASPLRASLATSK